MLTRKVCATIIRVHTRYSGAQTKLRKCLSGSSQGNRRGRHDALRARSGLVKLPDLPDRQSLEGSFGMFNVLSFGLTALSSKCVQATPLAEHSMRGNKAIRSTSIQLMMRR